jgi:hypothetical protein
VARGENQLRDIDCSQAKALAIKRWLYVDKHVIAPHLVT